MRPALAFISLLAPLTACAAPVVGERLSPRAAEAIDPRVPVVRPVAVGPVDAALAARLAELLGQARAGDTAFSAAFSQAERLAGSSGAPQSESWIAAQQALSAAVAAREPTTRALGDVDALAASRIAPDSTISRSDFEAIQAALAEVSTIDQRQAQAIERLQRQLGS